jgi:hypothetical protein
MNARMPSTSTVFEVPALLAWVASATKRVSSAAFPKVPSTTPVSRTRSLAPLPASSSRVTMAARPPASAWARARS